MKKLVLVLVGVLIVVMIGVIILSLMQAPLRQPPAVVPTPTPVANPSAQFNTIDYSKIFRDPSIEKQVRDVLQNPTGSEEQGGYTLVSFPTDVSGRPNIVYEKNNTASYITQEITIDNNLLAMFVASHPNSQSVELFDSGSGGVGFTWSVFPEDGVAYLANKDSGNYTIRVLYFPPTTKGNFISNVAPTFQMSQTSPNTQDFPEVFDQQP